MSEYVFRDAGSFGCDMDEQMDGLPMTVREYFAAEPTDHYGTLHEEIVRCRDCAYICNREYANGLEYHTCGYFDSEYAEVEPDGFCAWAERREP